MIVFTCLLLLTSLRNVGMSVGGGLVEGQSGKHNCLSSLVLLLIPFRECHSVQLWVSGVVVFCFLFFWSRQEPFDKSSPFPSTSLPNRDRQMWFRLLLSKPFSQLSALGYA